jgi:ferritin-like metal-binding protein YciE
MHHASLVGKSRTSEGAIQTLEEEKAADEKLNQIAEGEVNAKAFKAA